MITEKTSCHVFEIARDFSRFPQGRTRADSGDHSGEALREKLVQALTGEDLYPGDRLMPILVFTGGTMGYGSNFLEEAFGGLVSKEGFSPDWLRENMKVLSSDDPSIAVEIWQYIDAAKLPSITRDPEGIVTNNIRRLNLEALLELVLAHPEYLTEPKYSKYADAIRSAAADLGVHDTSRD